MTKKEAGIIETIRYYRGNVMFQNKLDSLVVDYNTHGGICFFFQIDYNKNVVNFSAAITLESEPFQYSTGRKIAEEKFRAGNFLTFEYDQEGPGLIDQTYAWLSNRYLASEKLSDFERTLLMRMAYFNEENQNIQDSLTDIVREPMVEDIKLLINKWANQNQ